MSCPLKIEVDANLNSNWDPVGGGYVGAVAAFDDDTYIQSKAANTQWYSVDTATGADTTTVINRVAVTACFKSDSPLCGGGLRIDLGVNDSTVGANNHASRCDWSCVTEYFDLNPDVDPPVAFTWPDIENLKVGVTSLSDVCATDVTRLYVTVDCGDYWSPCPRCCCCCLCFTPVVTLGEFTLSNTITGAGNLTVPELEREVPFISTPGPTGGGCYWSTQEDLSYPQLVVEGSTIDVYLLEVAIEAGATTTPSCSRITAQYYYTGHGDSTPIGTITITWDTILRCCSPQHLSTLDTASSFIFNGGSPVDCDTAPELSGGCPSARIECRDGGVSGPRIDTDCVAIA